MRWVLRRAKRAGEYPNEDEAVEVWIGGELVAFHHQLPEVSRAQDGELGVIVALLIPALHAEAHHLMHAGQNLRRRV